MHKVYERFLHSSNLKTWSDCLEHYVKASGIEGNELNDEDLVQGLCISYYVQWLGRASGDKAAENWAKATTEVFVAALGERHGSAPNDCTTLGWAMTLAWRGYSTMARELLNTLTAIGPEALLLVLSKNSAQGAAEIRHFATAPAHELFFIALYIYCVALIEIGSSSEAKELLCHSAPDPTNPLVIDLLGRIHEYAGEWRDAHATYCLLNGPTQWPTHRYRAALCGIIANGGNAVGSADGELLVDDALAQTLRAFESEIDQAEVSRCTSFVDACRWNTFDDWVVRYELGKLNFRRRRYAEADAHLKRALVLAPNKCRTAIADLRFSNISWLSGASWSHELSMRPETFEAALDVIHGEEVEESKSEARAWLAAATRDNSLLPEEINDWALINKAEAHQLVGNRPEEIACLIDGLRDNYQHRVVIRLIYIFNAAQFERSVDYLARLIINESAEDFFALWELASSLLAIRYQYSESSSIFERLSLRLLALVDRLLELSQFEFQHLVRLYDLSVQIDRQDLAEDLLRRAAALAESAAESLAIAVARRRALWTSLPGGDPQALELLSRAHRESRDRLERLQIAREFFYQGHAQTARQILGEERIFDEHVHATHIEFVAALQCGPWMKPGEFESLAQAAYESIKQDVEVGAIRRYGAEFFKRLVEIVRVTNKSLAQDWTRAGAVNPGERRPQSRDDELAQLPAGVWKQWIDALEAKPDSITKQDMFLSKVDDLRDGGAFAEVLATWIWAQNQIARALESAEAARPSRNRQRTPISKSLNPEGDPRALQWCDLWRSFLMAGNELERRGAKRRLKSFEDEERRLTLEWENARRLEVKDALTPALRFSETSSLLLSSLLTGFETKSHPVFDGLYASVAEDSELQRAKLASLVGAIRAELAF